MCCPYQQRWLYSVSKLFENCKKFKFLDNDPTLTKTNSLQRYFNSLCKRADITKSKYDIYYETKKTQKKQERMVCQKLIKISQISLNLTDSRHDWN